jgi:hypothetical protein
VNSEAREGEEVGEGMKKVTKTIYGYLRVLTRLEPFLRKCSVLALSSNKWLTVLRVS